MTKEVKPPKIEVDSKKEFCFPKLGVTVKATSLQEALKLVQTKKDK